MLKLFDILLPKKEICMEESLYFRVSDSGSLAECFCCLEDHQISLNNGAQVTFDTYFNLFSFSKYLKYTVVDNIGVRLTLKGRFLIRLVGVYKGKDTASRVLVEKELDTQTPECIDLCYDFKDEQEEGFYYIELTAHSDEAVFYEGYYYSNPDESDLNQVSIAAAICTYKREDYVYRNLQTVKNYIDRNEDSPYKNNISFLIIDNGHTLDQSKIESEHVKVYRNKNYGGSGGFTRGIIEAYRERQRYTHVLLMDDDILFEPEILIKTVTFLITAKKHFRDLCIGGSMLRLDCPYLQHEAGGIWIGNEVDSVKPDLDLSNQEGLLLNELEEPIDFNGWWYSCFPLSLVEEKKLPLPLFIKMDDIEYGLRLGAPIVTLNGIGMWHDHFDNKFSPHLVYYLQRNKLIVNVLRFSKYGAISSIINFLYTVIKQIITQRYSMASYVFQAHLDFLKGVDFIVNLDEEQLNRRLMNQSIKQLADEQLLADENVFFEQEEYDRSVNKKLPWYERLLEVITLNGYLLPRMFYSKGSLPYTIVPMAGCSEVHFYKADKVLHYNLAERKGFVTKLDKRKLWTIGAKAIPVVIQLLLKYKKAAASYQTRVDEITSFEFWCKHLEIDPIESTAPPQTPDSPRST
ncbi:glycosyltransferase family 2 protein [Anoxybacterium hadale]|uniref:Glycosyltransferase family 2 protein n=1 Tax=Anoxybacterium hadale TaxID=3408580 RepID=A0ACD1AEU1_9FIRM|nr:glycosyltransferase family 2 protein [Clostridiales bacterium]